ncbi:MAG: DUF58 domain-containing protein [Bacteroidales bacterium]|jgi:uncharacterized protein (DUF58 family)|nr:DUF58 domain-containing protein [Bacteroidales bacterium]MBP5419543.1 DUF58 domain-containing protein [Bacteroidales bacterium]
METTELLKKVRQIEIKTRGLSNHIFAGEYHSAFKGRGMAFSEVREYQYGDDVRNIDWNVTARFNRPFIKIFEEERENTVMLLVDVSGSREFGTQERFKKNLVTEIAATLAFSTIQNNDKIGVIFFSDHVEQFIPPQKGKRHVLHIIRELLTFQPQNRKTSLNSALVYLTNAIKKHCTAFVLSDFMDHDFEKSLQIANHKHDVVALHIYDQREAELPNIGLMLLTDAERGGQKWIDTSDSAVRNAYAAAWQKHLEQLKTTFTKNGIDSVRIRTDEDYVKQLLLLFKQRS